MKRYIYNQDRIYIGSSDFDEMCQMPPMSTCVEPPTVNVGFAAKWNGTSWDVVSTVRTPEEIAAEVERLKAAKLHEILTKSDEAMNSLAASYSDNEKLSWPKQEAEAKALLTDPDASAQLLRGIAAARGIPLEELRDKVLANVSVSEQATAIILGTQQKYEDAVRAAETVEAVQEIVVDYAQ